MPNKLTFKHLIGGAGIRTVLTRNIRQIKRYIITGLLSASLEYTVLFVLTSLVGLWHILSNSIAVFMSLWLNFFLNRIWSFDTKGSIYKQLCRYSLLFVINVAASGLIMYVLSDIIGMYYIFSKAFATGVIVIWNFILYKKVIFK